jgi:hypothetical protein
MKRTIPLEIIERCGSARLDDERVLNFVIEAREAIKKIPSIIKLEFTYNWYRADIEVTDINMETYSTEIHSNGFYINGTRRYVGRTRYFIKKLLQAFYAAQIRKAERAINKRKEDECAAYLVNALGVDPKKVNAGYGSASYKANNLVFEAEYENREIVMTVAFDRTQKVDSVSAKAILNLFNVL